MDIPKDCVYWHNARKPEIEQLNTNLSADVAIVGGGITGLTAAQSFSDEGLKVALLEKDFCGAGASGKSSGFITPDSEFGFSDLISGFGRDNAKKIWDFGNFGVELIRKNIKKYNIKCGYGVLDALYVANNKNKIKSVEEEFNARNSFEYGTRLYSKSSLPKVLGGKGYYAGARFLDTFVMNPYQYCQSLKKELISLGVLIYENTNIIRASEKELRAASGYKISANKIIVCTDRFIPNLRKPDNEFYHIQTYLMVSKPLGAQMKKIFPEKEMMVWDSDINYKYFRPIGGGRLLMGGGDIVSLYDRNERHNNKKIYNKLDRYFRNKFPDVKAEWEYMWPGILAVSKDFIPIIAHEKNSEIYYAGAGAGLPWSAAIGRYISDKIIQGRNDYDKYFLSNRKFTPLDPVQPVLGKKITFALSHGYVKLVR